MARAIAWLLAGTLLCCSCGGEPPDPGPPGATRKLAWRAFQGAAPLAQTSRVARYQVFGQAPDWLLMAGRSEVGVLEQPDGDAPGVLWLSGPVGPERALEVLVSGRFDPTEVHRVVATLAFEGQVRVRAELQRSGRGIATGSTLAGTAPAAEIDAEAAAGPIPVEVHLDPPREAESCDQLSVRIEGTERAGVLSLELYRDPPAAALPPLEHPAPVEIDGEWRRVAGLPSGRALETRFQVQRGHALRIDYGLPRSARGPFEPGQLELELRGSDGLQRVYNLPLEYDQVVVYSELDPAVRKERMIRSKLRRIKSAGGREVARRKLERQFADKRGPAGAAFGEEPEPPRQRPDPASVPQGLIEGWIARTVELEEFVGQEVVARLELITAPGEPGLCAVGPPVLLGTALEKPLVLLITSDAHRADHLTAGGVEGRIETPWIDILARRGRVFAQAWSSSNAPGAALSALFSGEPAHPERSGAAPAPSLARCFAEAGFLTIAVVGDADLDPATSELTRDFEQVIAPTAGDFTADEGLDTLVELLPELQDQPAFVWVQLRDALAPYDPPAEFRREHYPEDRDPRKGARKLDEAERARFPDWAGGIADLGYVQALYAGEITWIDRRLRPLVESPRLARAVVAFAGTCGESLESFDHRRLSAETLRVPLLVCGPSLAGEPVQEPVEVCDLGRSLLDLARLRDVPFPGRSLLAPEAAGPAHAPRAHFALADDRSSAAVVLDGYLLAVDLDPRGQPLSGARLCAVELDPACAQDLSADQPQRAAELRALLTAWLTGDSAAVPDAGQPSAPPPQ